VANENAKATDGVQVDKAGEDQADHLGPVVADELDAAEQRVKDAQAARDELKKQKRERS